MLLPTRMSPPSAVATDRPHQTSSLLGREGRTIGQRERQAQPATELVRGNSECLLYRLFIRTAESVPAKCEIQERFCCSNVHHVHRFIVPTLGTSDGDRGISGGTGFAGVTGQVREVASKAFVAVKL